MESLNDFDRNHLNDPKQHIEYALKEERESKTGKSIETLDFNDDPIRGLNDLIDEFEKKSYVLLDEIKSQTLSRSYNHVMIGTSRNPKTNAIELPVQYYQCLVLRARLINAIVMFNKGLKLINDSRMFFDSSLSKIASVCDYDGLDSIDKALADCLR